MTIYIEDCLIENFAVTFLILKGVEALFKTKINKWRLLSACCFASIISLLYPLFGLSGMLLVCFKCVLGYLIVAIAFNTKQLFAKYVTFIFLTALYAGLNILTYYLIYGSVEIYDNFPTYILLAILFVIYYVLNMLTKLLKKNLMLTGFTYVVNLKVGEKEIKELAFLDSGNALKDQDSTPIIIINFNLFNRLYNNISFEDIILKNYKNLIEPHYVQSGFASGSGKLLVFTITSAEIEVSGEKKIIQNAKLGLSYAKFNKNFNCNMLLGVNCLV